MVGKLSWLRIVSCSVSWRPWGESIATAGGLVMGNYKGASQHLWPLAKEFVLADHFHHAAFGGSFLNHFWLICACTPEFRAAPAKMIAALDPQTGFLAVW